MEERERGNLSGLNMFYVGHARLDIFRNKNRRNNCEKFRNSLLEFPEQKMGDFLVN